MAVYGTHQLLAIWNFNSPMCVVIINELTDVIGGIQYSTSGECNCRLRTCITGHSRTVHVRQVGSIAAYRQSCLHARDSKDFACRMSQRNAHERRECTIGAHTEREPLGKQKRTASDDLGRLSSSR